MAGTPFFLCLDEQHLWAAIRYVERNPVRAGMVGGPKSIRGPAPGLTADYSVIRYSIRLGFASITFRTGVNG